MNVGIDITSIIYDRGVSRYTSNLVQSLVERRDVNLSLFGSSLRQKTELEKFVAEIQQELKLNRQAKCQVSIQSYPPTLQNFLWNRLHTNSMRKILPGIEVFHSWDWLQPPDRSLPLVSTIHDLAILRFPETAHPKILQMHQQSWKILKERKAQIIAVSHATKKDIVELLEYPASLVHVVHEALPRETSMISKSLDEESYEQLKQKLNLNAPYILFVGTREPRKNLLRLIDAWLPLAADLELIVVGEEGWDGSGSQKIGADQQAKLRFLGKVSNQELAVLYGEAQALVFPSLYEGFGLPILEAFYHGTPVVTSDASSMAEVAGNAAVLVDPFTVESIREGIVKILNEDLEEQQKRLQRMIIRLHLFDWQRVAEQTVEVYRQAIDYAA